ncbi:unnamed protein product [Anisakis simplex]|uniref:Uncharacterized protein n=1 Tax=Anisakis simplex TaxID=6269 RepID=A0A3P6TY95_ANISI|nr:unnamed protein product [Anisakis simplex]
MEEVVRRLSDQYILSSTPKPSFESLDSEPPQQPQQVNIPLKSPT